MKTILLIYLILFASLALIVSSAKFVKKGLEGDLIDAAIAEYNESVSNRSKKSTKNELLCVVFMQATLRPLVTLYANMGIMGKYCDWALVMYSGEDKYESIICNDGNFVGKIVHCKRISSNSVFKIDITDPAVIKKACEPIPISDEIIDSLSSKDNNAVRLNSPKSLLYHEILPYLPHYKRVMMLDEDISLLGFNISQSLETWDCAYSPPPLIVQPLVYESRQFYSFLGLKQWQQWKLVSSATGLIEQQVPMFESNFLSWFIRHVLNVTVSCSTVLGVEWGMDRTWCNAARSYGRFVLNWDKYQLPCALLISGSGSVHHLDTRSIRSKRTDPLIFRAKGSIVINKYKESFPQWFTTNMEAVNPLNKKYAKRYPRARKNDKKCLSSRVDECVFPFC